MFLIISSDILVLEMTITRFGPSPPLPFHGSVHGPEVQIFLRDQEEEQNRQSSQKAKREDRRPLGREEGGSADIRLEGVDFKHESRGSAIVQIDERALEVVPGEEN